MIILNILLGLIVTVVLTATIGTVLYLILGYFTYYDPSDDFHKIVTRIRKRSWE